MKNLNSSFTWMFICTQFIDQLPVKQMVDQGEGLSISSWVGELDRVALTSEADS